MIAEIANNFCYFSRKYLQIGYPGCDYYSIWNFPTLPTTSKGLWQQFTTPQEGKLPLVYWYVLVVNILTLAYTTKQFLEGFQITDPSKIPWPKTHWYEFNDDQLHRAWLARNWLMMSAWLGLFVAMISLELNLVVIYLMLYGGILLVDIIFLAGARWELRFGILTSYMWPICNILCANSLRIGAMEVLKQR